MGSSSDMNMRVAGQRRKARSLTPSKDSPCVRTRRMQPARSNASSRDQSVVDVGPRAQLLVFTMTSRPGSSCLQGAPSLGSAQLQRYVPMSARHGTAPVREPNLSRMPRVATDSRREQQGARGCQISVSDRISPDRNKLKPFRKTPWRERSITQPLRCGYMSR
jgi:hypothetical protein